MIAGSDFIWALAQAAPAIAHQAPAGGLDWNAIVLTAVAALFGGGAFWGFLRATRSATSGEYQQFVRDLQQERRDRERAVRGLERRLRQAEKRIAFQEVEFAEIEGHVRKLESEITRLGGTPPPRPVRQAWSESEDDEEEPPEDEQLAESPVRRH